MTLRFLLTTACTPRSQRVRPISTRPKACPDEPSWRVAPFLRQQLDLAGIADLEVRPSMMAASFSTNPKQNRCCARLPPLVSFQPLSVVHCPLWSCRMVSPEAVPRDGISFPMTNLRSLSEKKQTVIGKENADFSEKSAFRRIAFQGRIRKELTNDVLRIVKMSKKRRGRDSKLASMGWTYVAPTSHLRRKSIRSRTIRDIQASSALYSQ